EVKPEELTKITTGDRFSRHHIYKVVFKEWHMVEPASAGHSFELQDYYDHPENYRGVFEQYIPHLDVLVNAIYWTERYPRLLTKAYLKEQFGGPETPRLRVIGDISCDVEGAVECTVKSTEPGDPVYVYDPVTGAVVDGHEG
ncbi:MAG: hypothetical protein GWN58_40510, partial [Anaerolineae bacterium]|nr:hypothetical protein [Anaerolineae bacterium]